MKVVNILPGSGGTFYCENCMRDSALARELRRHGHDVILVPMYLPMYTDDPDIAGDSPVFFGGINVYLQQKIPLFRRTPRWLDRLFDSRWMLGLAAKREGTTAPAGMGAMTLSMIRGRDGRQVKEVERLVTWLKEQEQPEIVHIATTMLIGLARPIREALGVPVICSALDEDVWLDPLDPPYNQTCWEAIAALTGEVDLFIAPSEYYARFIRERLGLACERVRTVPIGIDLDGFEAVDLSFDPPVIGFLSKMSASLGLDRLVEAFMRLKSRPGMERARLRAMGGITGSDRQFIQKLESELAEHGMQEDVEFLTEVDRESRLAFLRSLTLLSVPVPKGEAFGTFVVEAWGMGVPVVQPRVAGFTELLEGAGGGVAYEDRGAESLADALEQVLRDPAAAAEMGARGRQAVVDRYNIGRMAEEMGEIYGSLIGKRKESLSTKPATWE